MFGLAQPTKKLPRKGPVATCWQTHHVPSAVSLFLTNELINCLINWPTWIGWVIYNTALRCKTLTQLEWVGLNSSVWLWPKPIVGGERVTDAAVILLESILVASDSLRFRDFLIPGAKLGNENSILKAAKEGMLPQGSHAAESHRVLLLILLSREMYPIHPALLFSCLWHSVIFLGCCHG